MNLLRLMWLEKYLIKLKVNNMFIRKKKAISKDLKLAELKLDGKSISSIDSGYEVVFSKSDIPKLKKLIRNLEQER